MTSLEVHPSPEIEDIAKKDKGTKTPLSELLKEEEMATAIRRQKSPASKKAEATPGLGSPGSEKPEATSTRGSSVTKKSSPSPRRYSKDKLARKEARLSCLLLWRSVGRG